MTRFFTMLAATAFAALAVGSACFASDRSFSPDDIHFTMTPARQAGDVQLSLRTGDHGNSSSSYAASALSGLDLAAFRQGGPIQFALVRDAGRIDCSGRGSAGRADGKCLFSADPAFADFLAGRGIGRPTLEQSYALTMVEAHRELVEALHAARYPAPTIDELTGMAAVGVSRAFIDDLAKRGYRPAEIDDLIAFAALDITPAYIDEMSRAGFKGLDADAIVQFKALGVSPAFVAELARNGYANLSADEVVQLKALDVSPAFIRSFADIGYPNLPVDMLVQLKALDVRPADVQALRSRGFATLSPEQLVAMRAVGAIGDRRK